jgi:hypothetical protein
MIAAVGPHVSSRHCALLYPDHLLAAFGAIHLKFSDQAWCQAWRTVSASLSPACLFFQVLIGIMRTQPPRNHSRGFIR